MFSHPPTGTCGFTEQEARKEFGDENIKIYKTKFTAMYHGRYRNATAAVVAAVALLGFPLRSPVVLLSFPFSSQLSAMTERKTATAMKLICAGPEERVCFSPGEGGGVEPWRDGCKGGGEEGWWCVCCFARVIEMMERIAPQLACFLSTQTHSRTRFVHRSWGFTWLALAAMRCCKVLVLR